MARLHLITTPSLLTLGIFLPTAQAVYDRFFYATEAENWACPGKPNYQCRPPGICARDTLLDEYYCCDAGAGQVCWNFAVECEGEGENEPSGGQMGCGSGENKYCCRAEREECTQHDGQMRICWATQTNPISNITAEKSNDTFFALSAAAPSAPTLSVDIASLLEIVSSTSSSSASTVASSAPTVQNSPPNTTQSEQEPDSKGGSSLSGGAIGGIVVGALAALVIIGLAIFFLRRKKKAVTTGELNGNPYVQNGYAQNGHGAMNSEQEKYTQVSHPLMEMDSHNDRNPVEVEGSLPGR